MQQIHQAALHHKQGRLGVARVVEVAQLTTGFPGADGGQIAAQQLRGQSKAFLAQGVFGEARSHALLLRTLPWKHPCIAHCASRCGGQEATCQLVGPSQRSRAAPQLNPAPKPLLAMS